MLCKSSAFVVTPTVAYRPSGRSASRGGTKSTEAKRSHG